MMATRTKGCGAGGRAGGGVRECAAGRWRERENVGQGGGGREMIESSMTPKLGRAVRIMQVARVYFERVMAKAKGKGKQASEGERARESESERERERERKR